jgi:hypothetical protein
VFLGAIILVAAAVLAARALMKDNVISADTASAGFASVPAIGQASAPDNNVGPATNEAAATADSVVEKEISALADLNAVAAATDGVSVYLPGRNDAPVKTPLTPMRSAARTIESQARVKIGLFTLKTASRDYEQIAAQMTVPGVLAMVKGRGMVPVTGEITETKLVQGFVAASSAGGCGPSAGCGPSTAGCGPRK